MISSPSKSSNYLANNDFKEYINNCSLMQKLYGTNTKG
jgi:hypothetical protein